MIEHCKDCRRPPLPGKRRCKRCAKAHNFREAARREERRKTGLCTVCGAPAVVDDEGEAMAHCDEHRAAYAVRRAALAQRARAVRGAA
jgi:hypothetical protein